MYLGSNWGPRNFSNAFCVLSAEFVSAEYPWSHLQQMSRTKQTTRSPLRDRSSSFCKMMWSKVIWSPKVVGSGRRSSAVFFPLACLVFRLHCSFCNFPPPHTGHSGWKGEWVTKLWPFNGPSACWNGSHKVSLNFRFLRLMAVFDGTVSVSGDETFPVGKFGLQQHQMANQDGKLWQVMASDIQIDRRVF